MDKKNIKLKYTNDEVTIVWKPAVCIHSTICWKGVTGLLQVFNPAEKTWINPQGAPTSRIIEQIEKCPSGALSYFMNVDADKNESIAAESIVEIMPNGPLLVYGNLVVKDKEGNETRKNKVTAFCRCGGSSNKPFCDGTHSKNNFIG